MSTPQPDSLRRTGELPWPFAPVGLPLFYLWLAWSWWFETRAQIQSAAEALPALDAATMATLGLGARALATLSEAGVYALWWKGRGQRLPYWRFVSWVAALSSADLVASSLRRAAVDAPPAIRTLAALMAGPGALDISSSAAGAMVGFGSLGMLTIARVSLTSWAQARGIGRPIAGPLLLTTSAWLVTRLIGWWSFDLMRGRSPVP